MAITVKGQFKRDMDISPFPLYNSLNEEQTFGVELGLTQFLTRYGREARHERVGWMVYIVMNRDSLETRNEIATTF